jgi:hypothetical protein
MTSDRLCPTVSYDADHYLSPSLVAGAGNQPRFLANPSAFYLTTSPDILILRLASVLAHLLQPTTSP